MNQPVKNITRLSSLCQPIEAMKMHLEELVLRRSAIRGLREIVRDSTGGICIYCGLEFNFLTCDHIKPRVAGGRTAHWNLVPACVRCNQRKGSQNVWEWWQRSGEFDEALQDGRVELLLSVLSDRRNLAEFLCAKLAENPSFRLRAG